MKELILEVTNVQIFYHPVYPKKIIILADGLTSSSCWKDGELRLSDKAIPEDGIYKFDFYATRIKEVVCLPVLTPIKAHYVFDGEPANFKGVTVCAKCNCITTNDEATAAATKDAANEIMPYLETLIGLEVTDTELKIRVPSNGCTTKDSFKTYVVTEVSGRYLMVFRIKPDLCLTYMPDGVEIEYDLSELGLKPKETFMVENSFGKLQLSVETPS